MISALIRAQISVAGHYAVRKNTTAVKLSPNSFAMHIIRKPQSRLLTLNVYIPLLLLLRRWNSCVGEMYSSGWGICIELTRPRILMRLPMSVSFCFCASSLLGEKLSVGVFEFKMCNAGGFSIFIFSLLTNISQHSKALKVCTGIQLEYYSIFRLLIMFVTRIFEIIYFHLVI